jgi:hypothetical protein
MKMNIIFILMENFHPRPRPRPFQDPPWGALILKGGKKTGKDPAEIYGMTLYS